MTSVSRRLVIASSGVEVPGSASRGRNRIGLAFADRVNMQPVEPGGQGLVGPASTVTVA